MTTITEDYVSFEIAKLLKEKGFNEPCYACYLNKELSHYDYTSTNFELIDNAISAPTIQMVMKWLREVHNIHIDVCSIWDVIHWIYQVFVITPRTASNSYVDEILYTSYEEACEEAIKYCLKNLI